MFLQRRVSLAKSVARILRQRLTLAHADGGRLPSEPDIATELGVSRGTVRQALAILEREGAIFRRQGAGTFVNPYLLHIQARVETAYEFTSLIQQAGYRAGIRVISVARQPLPLDFLRLDDPHDRLRRQAGAIRGRQFHAGLRRQAIRHDPLREGQRRCQEMGEAAANDAACLGIWAETRDRFLGRTPAPSTPGPDEGR